MCTVISLMSFGFILSWNFTTLDYIVPWLAAVCDKIVIDFPSFFACNVTDLCKVRRLIRARLLGRPFMDGMADKDAIS